MEETLPILYWNVASNQRVKASVRKLADYYCSQTDNANVEMKDDDWDSLWGSYSLDVMLYPLVGGDMNKYIVSVESDLKKAISTLTGLSKRIVETIIKLSHYSALESTPLVPYKSLPEPYRIDGDRLIIGEVTINNYGGDVLQSLRYELVKGAILTIDLDIEGFTKVCVDTLQPGNSKGVGLFIEDVNSASGGMSPIDYVRSLGGKKSSLLVFLPNSQRYSQLLVTALEKHLSSSRSSRVICIGRHGDLKTKNLTSHQFLLDLNVLVSDEKLVDLVEKASNLKLPEFPYIASLMPTYESMFKNLVEDIAGNLSKHMEWSVSKQGCRLGIVTRKFPEDYQSTDSLEDIFVERVRMRCREENRRSPYMAWKSLYLKNPEIVKLPIREQRELVYEEERGCNLFNAALATYIISRFLGPGAKLLDPTVGWGERKDGGWAAGISEFHGWDTNPELFEPYAKQKAEIERILGRSINSKVKNGPFEDDAKLFENGPYTEYFDGCLNSLPFFTQEEYIGKETSTQRYKGIKQWVDGFMIPTFTACYQGLKPGGYMMCYLPSSYGDEKKRIEELAPLSQMKPYTEQLMKKLGATYEGSLGFILQSKGSPDKVRETFVWRKPYHPTKSLMAARQTVTKVRIYSDSSMIAGTFTHGLDFFSSIRQKTVNVLVQYPCFDVEAICYCCSQRNLDCVVIMPNNMSYSFNKYGASVEYVDSLDEYVPSMDTFVFHDGCNERNLIETTMKKIKAPRLGKSESIWCYDSPGIVALLSRLYPSNSIFMVTCRRGKHNLPKNVKTFLNDRESVRQRISGIAPSFPAHPMFDAKVWAFYSKKQGDWLWVNK
jgi:hypothetical protein